MAIQKKQLKKDAAPQAHDWYIIDATGIRLGKLASTITKYLQGKTKGQYTPSSDNGDYIIVLNSKKVDVFPRRYDRKKYYSHSGYPGGLKEITYGELQKQKPNDIIKKAVIGMMPKTKLGKIMSKKLFIYEGAEHPHEAQKPKLIEV